MGTGWSVFLLLPKEPSQNSLPPEAGTDLFVKWAMLGNWYILSKSQKIYISSHLIPKTVQGTVLHIKKLKSERLTNLLMALKGQNQVST
jgi:hypothetical protein